MSRAAQNLCFHKNLCQIVFILIREFKQLAESVCVCSVKLTDANTLQHEHFFFFLKWMVFSVNGAISPPPKVSHSFFRFLQPLSGRPNRPFV